MTGTEPRATDLCAVVLAAGLGTRLRPITARTPKALCPIDNVPLLDLAIDSVRPFAADIAVNVSYLAEQVRTHLAGRPVFISDETSGLLGSAGALGHLQDWIGGRAVLVRNADAYLTDDLTELVHGWDGLHPRLLARQCDRASDFGTIQYIGACLLPASAVAEMPDDFASLYDLVWQPAWERGELQFVLTEGEFVDCGTARDYWQANMIASGGHSVIGARAKVAGQLDRVVVWPDSTVAATESLSNCIRIGADLTVDAS